MASGTSTALPLPVVPVMIATNFYPLTARRLPLQAGGGSGGHVAGLDPVAGGEAGAAPWLQRGFGSLTAAASAAAGQSHDARQQDASAAEPLITFSLSLSLLLSRPSLCQNSSLAQLMEQVLEMESMSNQVLRWREVPSSQNQSATWCSDRVSDRST